MFPLGTNIIQNAKNSSVFLHIPYTLIWKLSILQKPIQKAFTGVRKKWSFFSKKKDWGKKQQANVKALFVTENFCLLKEINCLFFVYFLIEPLSFLILSRSETFSNHFAFTNFTSPPMGYESSLLWRRYFFRLSTLLDRWCGLAEIFTANSMTSRHIKLFEKKEAYFESVNDFRTICHRLIHIVPKP